MNIKELSASIHIVDLVSNSQANKDSSGYPAFIYAWPFLAFIFFVYIVTHRR